MRSPLAMVVRKQLLESFSSRRFLVAAILCVLVGTGATIVRTQTYLSALSTYRQNRIQHSAEAKRYTSPYFLTYDGVSVDKRPNPLASFYRGLEPDRPLTVRMTGNRDPRTVDQYDLVNPVAELFQTVDFVSFTVLVMSLLALVFSYDAVSGEKETGTLRATFSNPISRSQLILGKWMGGGIAVCLPFVLTALCSLGVFALMLGGDLSGSTLASYGGLVLAGLLFTSAYFAFGLLVSARTHRSFTSITVLVAVWVATTVAIPHLSPYAARIAVETPTIQEVERKKWVAADEENAIRGRRWREYRNSTTDNEEQRGVVISELYRDCFAQIARRQEQIQSDFERRVDGQVETATWLSRISPASSLVYAAGAATGTGLQNLRVFRRELHSYRVRFLNYAEDKWIERARQGGGDIQTEDYPRFAHFPVDVTDRLATSLPDIGLLALWNVLLFAAAYVSFLRYDVR